MLKIAANMALGSELPRSSHPSPALWRSRTCPTVLRLPPWRVSGSSTTFPVGGRRSLNQDETGSRAASSPQRPPQPQSFPWETHCGPCYGWRAGKVCCCSSTKAAANLHRVRAEPYGYHLLDRIRLQVATDGDCYDYRRCPQEAPSWWRNMAPGIETWSAGSDWRSRRPTWGAWRSIPLPPRAASRKPSSYGRMGGAPVRSRSW
jgi:hypothetical protein